MSTDSITMRMKVLEDYLKGWGDIGGTQHAFANFPKLSFDEEQVDMAIIGACQRRREASLTEVGMRQVFEEVIAYLKKQR